MISTFELTNEQRKYFGLEPVEDHWAKVILKGDTYRTESTLYFDGETIKKQIFSTVDRYSEVQFDELTKGRNILLPKTNKGKEKKLTASVLEQRQPQGIYLSIQYGTLTIGNYTTQTTFYSSRWDNEDQIVESISEVVDKFIQQSPANHLEEITKYRNAKRKNVKFKSGDYFCFKLDRSNYGFGRVVLDVNKLRKKELIERNHGLFLLMGPPVIVELFIYKSASKNVGIDFLDAKPKMPSDVMMDNLLLYGEFEIIGNREIKNEEFDFPISYGRSIDQRRVVFLQWGLIHKELPQEKFNKYIIGEKPLDQNPYGYYSIGFRPHYDSIDLLKSIQNNKFDFNNSSYYGGKWDLRNPKNKLIKEELFKEFGLDSNKNYFENCKLTKTPATSEFISKL